MKSFVAGVVIGIVMVGAGSALAMKPAKKKVMHGWMLSIEIEGQGVTCENPVVHEELKVIACAGGYSIDKYVPGWNTRDGR